MFGALRKAQKRKLNGELVLQSNQRKYLSAKLIKRERIIDLQRLCLNKLCFEDLSNAAELNSRLKQLVYNYVAKKCDGGTVTVYCSNSVHWLCIADTKGIFIFFTIFLNQCSLTSILCYPAGKFMFSDVSKLDDFFGKAGTKIPNLSIICAPITLMEKYQFAEESIFKHCFESLITIEIRSNLLPVLSNVTHIFSKTEQLTLDGCDLSENLCDRFDQYFPSLRRLELKDCKAVDRTCIEREFKCLKELIVIGKRKQSRKAFNKSNVKGALHHNPQITQLIIDFNSTNDRELDNVHPDFALDTDFYRCVGESLSNLKSLTVFGERRFQRDVCKDDIDFPILDKLILHDIYAQEPNEIAPFRLNKLRELKLMHMISLSDEWIQFIIRNNCLEKLTIDITWKWQHDEEYVQKKWQTYIDKEQLLTIIKCLSRLIEFHVSAAAVADPKDIMAILSKQKSLMKVFLRNYDDVDSIVDTFDKLTAKKRWHVGYDLHNLVLERIAQDTQKLKHVQKKSIQ